MSFAGKSAGLGFFYPDRSERFEPGSPSDQILRVGPSLEIAGDTNSDNDVIGQSVDVSSGQILLRATENGTLSEAPFNGFRLIDALNEIRPITDATLASSDMGHTPADVSWTSEAVSINNSGIEQSVGDEVVVDVAFGEPQFPGSTSVLVVDDERNLAKVNTDTGQSTLLHTTDNLFSDIAQAPDGTIYGATFTDLYRIGSDGFDETDLGFDLSGVNGLTFSPSGALFASSTDGRIMEIDFAERTATKIADVESSAGDLVYQDDALLIAQTNGDIIEVDLDSGAQSTVVQTGKKDLFGLAMPDGTEVEVFSGQQIFGMQTPEQVTNLSGSGIGDIRGAAPGYSVNALRDETTAEDITDLYIGLIGRAPDLSGLDFWVGTFNNQIEDGGTGDAALRSVAQAMFESPGARDYYPEALSNREVVEQFYENVLGREGDRAGIDFWTNALNQPGSDTGDVLVAMIDAVRMYSGDDPQALESQRLFDKKAAVATYYTDNISQPDETNIAASIDLINAVGPDTDIGSEQAIEALVENVLTGSNQVTADVSVAADPAFADLEGDIVGAVEAGLEQWAQFLDVPEAVTAAIAVNASDSDSLATGGSQYFSSDRLPNGDGVPSVLANKLMTGDDTNGTDPDANINLSRQNLDKFVFSGPIGSGEYSAESIMAHELGHALGIQGFFNDADATLSTSWDAGLVQTTNGIEFRGENAVAANGGEEIRLDGDSHLSESVFDTALMTPLSENGGGDAITDVEIGILRDIGLPVANDAEALLA